MTADIVAGKAAEDQNILRSPSLEAEKVCFVAQQGVTRQPALNVKISDVAFNQR